jgi:hypothetical protein
VIVDPHIGERANAAPDAAFSQIRPFSDPQKPIGLANRLLSGIAELSAVIVRPPCKRLPKN